MGKIHLFSDLNAWKEAYELVILVYKLTDKFPAKENYALTGQMRRSAVSISSNIAEGFSRRGKREKILFYSTSLGSLTELQSQVLIAKGVGYLSGEDVTAINERLTVVHKLINGLIKGVTKLHNT
ncbi:MAG: 23S rRNA-intervening sequence protein [Candidatus Woesebacteria bacterium]|jgi:four helix bundle protein|nr:MAG: 23S rRNA-intervening sequence protein [Candidatus Woesebacteria bacterium]